MTLNTTPCCSVICSTPASPAASGRGFGWAEEGRRYRRAQRLGPTALVEAGGMAERGRLEALDVGRHPCHDCGRGFIWRAGKYGIGWPFLCGHDNYRRRRDDGKVDKLFRYAGRLFPETGEAPVDL